ncbi:MAG: glycoside hydrolase family 2 protein [Oscillospiraceae bacterium]|nr:glycoside hydrolase family 2 protein [Oscillospiraceae bacterium]
MRHILSLNEAWRFHKEDQEEFEILNLPHTWNAVDGMDGGGDYWRGTGIYEKTLTRAELPRGERIYLEFRGANSSADVYVNGVRCAHHDGGYSAFRCEITHLLADEMTIRVEVNNAPNRTVYPQVADFTFYGGLYRQAFLIGLPQSHFDLTTNGTPGIHVTPTVEGKNGRARVKVYTTDRKPGQRIRYVLYSNGKEIASHVTDAETVDFLVKNVHLWDGKRDPHCYHVEADLLDGGEKLDNVGTHFGFRTFSVDPERGFLLNGREYPLRGVARHQDRIGFGNALLPEHHNEDIELIRELGATTIRLAHYQHDQYFYTLCDEAGLVIWAEIPYISQHMPEGRENTVSQMTELITQCYNHPSICFWGLSNEITMNSAEDPDLIVNHRILNNLVKKLDPIRLTTVAALSMCPMDATYLTIPDVVSYNHYFGWYGGDTDMNGPWLDKFHAKNPNIPIGVSEYGCEALNWHTSNPVQGDYTEEYQAHYHEELIRQLYTRPYIWATHCWNMFDFGADARAEGGENGQNHKGLVTIDRKYKKDAFYAYKAWLSDEPFVHICGKRYTDRVEDLTKVSVYSNQPEVELFANGESLGKLAAEDHFFYFSVPNVGETTLVAVAGDCRDESFLRKVDTFNEDYRMKEAGTILNWFDITEPEGRFSLNDKVGDIMGTLQGKLLMLSMVKKLLPKGKKGEKPTAAGFEINGDMMQMVAGFTLLRLLNMAGGMLDLKLTKEDLLELNRKLNRIKKPRK